MKLDTYLFFDGQCEAAFKLYEKVLGGRIVNLVRYSEIPPGNPAPEGDPNRIMHVRLEAGGSALMGSDAPAAHHQTPQGFRASITVAEPEEAERIFNALAEGGTVTMGMVETFWSRRFGMLKDRFGTPWMINCEKPPAGAHQGAHGGGGAKAESKPFVISRSFEAPRDLVWRALTEPERMAKWWGPRGFTVVASRMDLRPGGTYLYGLRAPDGKEMWGRFLYREITPPSRLVLENSFSDANGGITRHPMSPTWPLKLSSTFDLAESGRQTTLTVSWSPLDATPEERATFDAGHASMTQGWTGTLDSLGEYLAQARI